MNGPGIVKSLEWIMTPSGDEYLYVWCEHWEVVTDKAMGERLGLESFRSTERWQLIGRATVDGNPSIILPGCQVKSWVSCGVPPLATKKILVVQ